MEKVGTDHLIVSRRNPAKPTLANLQQIRHVVHHKTNMDRSKKKVSMKPKIPENKLKAFNMGTMNVTKNPTKREIEQKRKKDEEEATAEVYQQFVDSFDDSKKKPMSWIRGGTVQVKEEGRVTSAAAKGKLYLPKSKFSAEPPPKNEPKDKLSTPKTAAKKKEEKKKSNLEIFKEELKLIQTERQERHRVKKIMREADGVPQEILDIPFIEEDISPFQPIARGSYIADPIEEATSTNIYVGNINPKMTEQQLCEVFGKFGPLASVKIMWPRTEEEKSRGRNCGFVAFMNRKDGERATESIMGTDVMGFEMKLGWGKPVPIPPHPVYIPPALAEMTLPPPPSGLPFNAQPMTDREFRKYMRVQPSHGHNKTLANAVVKVVVPTERNILCIIHRMVEFVVKEGPLFEAIIMNREMNNPMFRFLFENQIPAHTYYRWKLYSVLQGDSASTWRQEPFRMFKGGSIWQPPPINPYSKGMPDNLVEKPEIVERPLPVATDEQKKGDLTETQRDRLEDLLRDIEPEKLKIGDAMVWCLDHANAAEEVVQCITESLSIAETPLPKKIARIYLVSDVLFNCSAKVPNASWFRKCFQSHLEDICNQLHSTYAGIDGRLKAEQFKQRIMACFRAWEDWNVYQSEFLIKLQNIFLGLTPKLSEESLSIDGNVDGDIIPAEDMFAGEPIEDFNGKPMEESVEDVDGVAIVETTPAASELDPLPVSSKFTKSKWETIDKDELESEAQAVSKWDLFEAAKVAEDVDGIPMEEDVAVNSPIMQTSSLSTSEIAASSKMMTEEKRSKLRDIEVKVMKYQDEIESGKKSRKTDMSLSEQVERYRQKLLQKEEKKTEKEKQKEDRKRLGREPGSSDNEEVEANISHNLARLRAQYADSPRSTPRSRGSPHSDSRGHLRSPSPRRPSRRSRRSRSRSPLRNSRSPTRHKHKHKKKH